MANESIIAIPLNVGEPKVLRTFLLQLVERLDIVLGTRGDDAYVKQSDLSTATTTFGTLQSEQTALRTDLTALTTVVTDLSDTVEDNTTDISTNTTSINSLLTHILLGATYYDFNNAIYQTLQGRGEFNVVGSSITNAPYAIVPANTYYNFITSATTINGGVVQELRVHDDVATAPQSFYRIGDTFADVLALGWI